MGKDAFRSVHHADPPGAVGGSSEEEPERAVRASNDITNEKSRIKECEEELQNRWEAIMALRDVVMKQREAIRSLKAERHDKEPTAPMEEIREETVSNTTSHSTLSGSDSTNTEESESAEIFDHTNSPPSSFDPSHRGEAVEEEVSAITYEEEESSIDSSDFLKMESEMQAVMESAKAQATSPVDTVISFKTSEASKQEQSTPSANGGIKGVIESIQEQASHVDAAIALDELQTTKNELRLVTGDLSDRNAEVEELKNQVKVLESQIATLELERDLHLAEATRARDDLKECIQYVVKLKTREEEEESRRSSMVTEPTSNVTLRQSESLDSSAIVTPEKPSPSAVSIRPIPSAASGDDKPRQATPSTQGTEAMSLSARFPDDHSVGSFSSDGYPRRNLALCFWTQRAKETVDKGPAFERMDEDIEPRRMSMFRRRSKHGKKEKKKDKSSSHQKDARTKSSQRGRAAKLNQSLAEADRDADELRTRLHSITRYYDNIAATLQQNAGSNNTEYEADMINQLSFLDREKRAVMSELRQRDAIIASYQREIAQLAGNAKDGHNEIPEPKSALV